MTLNDRTNIIESHGKMSCYQQTYYMKLNKGAHLNKIVDGSVAVHDNSERAEIPKYHDSHDVTC